MNNLIYFVFGVIVGGVVVFVLMRKQGNGSPKGRKLMEVQAEEKEIHIQKIMQHFAGQDKMTNEDVQNLLGVSDATATRYMDELEKEGLVRQVGTSGPNVYYEKIS
ncbi:winged helix-turn-helix transcriptional regulator [Patescibacteria group bacterium]|nr:winged helix-turn-helix transcriptional regulator [Patescibacteria group bacterium]